MIPVNKRQRAVEHIVYEIMMFDATSMQLSVPISDQFLKNILLESFVIHSRVLFNFFYEKKKNLKDDISANDYILRKKEFKIQRANKSTLKNLTRKANKQIAHLTYSRNNYNQYTKGWDVSTIRSLMNQTIFAFIKCLEKEEKEWFFQSYRKYNLSIDDNLL